LINPSAIGLWEIKVKLAIDENGDFAVYEQGVEKAKSFAISDAERLKILGDHDNLLLLRRKYQELLQLGQKFPDDSFATVPDSLALKYFAIGIAKKNLSDDAAARSAFVKAKNILEEQLKQ